MRYKAAIGNKRLTDYAELKDVVVNHRVKTRNVKCCFSDENDTDKFLNEFIK